MIKFILNNQTIETDVPLGMTLLDFIRYQKNLKGTKIGCREGDCGACTILVGKLSRGEVTYRSMTSCLTPLANVIGKHVVTVEGINESDLTPIQKAFVDESGTQCGFCTVGFVMSMTGFCLDKSEKTCEQAVSAVDGNICRCTGYKSIERSAEGISHQVAESSERSKKEGVDSSWLNIAIAQKTVPEYFSGIRKRLQDLRTNENLSPVTHHSSFFVGGGTDLYVQKHDEMVYASGEHLFDTVGGSEIKDVGDCIEIGGSATVTDLIDSPVMQDIFPNLYKHLKLISSTPIRNMATLAGNFVNASPIGDMTVWFLALDTEIELETTVEQGSASGDGRNPHVSKGVGRRILLRDLYLGYKELAKKDDEIIKTIRFKKPTEDFHFNFEKVSKRTYLDIATVNTAISLRVSSPKVAEGSRVKADYTIKNAHVAAGGVSPIPLYLKETSTFLNGKKITEETLAKASEILQSEISPISDVRGSADYKRLLLRQLFAGHFIEMFGVEPNFVKARGIV